MTEYLPKELRDGLKAANQLARAKKSRLRVRAGDELIPVIRFWDKGFAVEAEAAPRLRGLVDIYDGTRHMFQCLIVAADEDDGEMCYDFKRATPATDHVPLDFERPDDAPAGLIGRN
ncbi:hypothetical protein GCM10011534_24230 [Pseudooceanicola nanhaiensis]|jgi:hypothetical protein|uniref:Uncharacterized protein n=1 Tax=Pseudooceanicola nanhaiensis TaxID=375761 RepID=A0A917SYN5_9RHOB|nr:hypothetical protein [Pseudooceanicola nanhaiensis]GGM01520.1 hypothetical protein GCM10011534_24230 [Pseudooceanicola nanhaiensis]